MWGCEQLADSESVARCAKGRVFTAVDLAFAVRPALPQVEAILRDFAVRGLVEPVLQTGWHATQERLWLSRSSRWSRPSLRHDLIRLGVQLKIRLTRDEHDVSEVRPPAAPPRGW